MNMFDLTDDLTHTQFQQLLAHLAQTRQPPTRRALRDWRTSQGLPTDDAPPASAQWTLGAFLNNGARA